MSEQELAVIIYQPARVYGTCFSCLTHGSRMRVTNVVLLEFSNRVHLLCSRRDFSYYLDNPLFRMALASSVYRILICKKLSRLDILIKSGFSQNYNVIVMFRDSQEKIANFSP